MYPGKPFSTRGENPAKSFTIFFKRKTFTTKINPSTQEGASNPRNLALKRGAHFSQRSAVAEISQLTRKICFHNGDFTFTYTNLNLSTEVSIGSTGLTSLSHIIIIIL
jgi:hypothetical protein